MFDLLWVTTGIPLNFPWGPIEFLFKLILWYVVVPGSRAFQDYLSIGYINSVGYMF